MAASLNEIYRLLGELTGSVKAIDNKVDALGKDMSASELKSDTSRANVHRRLDEVVMRTAHLESDMLTVKNRVEGMEMVTDEIKNVRQQLMGAGSLGRWLWWFGGWIVAAAATVMAAYTWLTGRPPP